jgi:hypothetical protein
LKTFAELKALADNPRYRIQKREMLNQLNDDMIDPPIVDLVNGFNRLPYCFTLQSCHGHFVYTGQSDPRHLGGLPAKGIIANLTYRIAYMAFCIENSASGRWLFEALRAMTAVDPENVQFCCANWFWQRQVNSYVLQVVPDRFKCEDTASIELEEALHVERTRNQFFVRLGGWLEKANLPPVVHPNG